MTDLVRKKVKKIIVYGEAKEKLKKTFESVVGVEECEMLDEAVKKAKREASSGDCVMLSPMCTSFDMFTDFEERGRTFKEIVHQLN